MLKPKIARWPQLTIATLLRVFGRLNPYFGDFIVPMDPSTWARSRLMRSAMRSETLQSRFPFGSNADMFYADFLGSLDIDGAVPAAIETENTRCFAKDGEMFLHRLKAKSGVRPVFASIHEKCV